MNKWLDISFIIFLAIVFVVCVLVSLGLTLRIFEPAYEVKIEGKHIGYVKEKEDFQKVFDTIVKERGAYKTYIRQNPIYKMVFVKKTTKDKENIYTNLREVAKSEYLIYELKFDGNVLEFSTIEQANKYKEELFSKENITSEINEKLVEEYKTSDIQLANRIVLETISRYKNAREQKERLSQAQKLPNKTPNRNSSVIYYPTDYKVVNCKFGGYKGHTGIDLKAKLGSNIYAYKSGKVIFSGYNGAYGYLVKIQHNNNVVTYYAHNSRLLVNKGDYVLGGQVIAKAGSTGNSTGVHLHFEYRINGISVDPSPYIFSK